MTLLLIISLIMLHQLQMYNYAVSHYVIRDCISSPFRVFIDTVVLC